MSQNLRFDFDVNRDDHTVTVVREFAAPLDRVWEAWTVADKLDRWWAPKPYRATTKELQLKPGGRWLYAMVGPDNSEQWCRADYLTVDVKRSFSYDDTFCDADGNATSEIAGSHWDVVFEEVRDKTTVTVTMRHKSAADLEQILKMGFREGFSMGLGNLDELLAGA